MDNLLKARFIREIKRPRLIFEKNSCYLTRHQVIQPEVTYSYLKKIIFIFEINCIICFFKIFINQKTFKKTIKEAKIDSTTYMNSLCFNEHNQVNFEYIP